MTKEVCVVRVEYSQNFCCHAIKNLSIKQLISNCQFKAEFDVKLTSIVKSLGLNRSVLPSFVVEFEYCFGGKILDKMESDNLLYNLC